VKMFQFLKKEKTEEEKAEKERRRKEKREKKERREPQVDIFHGRLGSI